MVDVAEASRGGRGRRGQLARFDEHLMQRLES